MAQGAGVPAGLVEAAEEGIHAVLAGENEPVVHFKAVKSFIHAFVIIGWGFDGNGGDFQGFRALFIQHIHQAGGLGAGTGDDDSFPKEGTVVKPAHFFSELYHIPHHEYRRRLDVHFFHILRCPSQGGGIGFLIGTGAPADEGGRRIGASSVLHELGGNESRMAYAHEENEGIHAAGQFIPVNGRFVLGWVLMARNHRKGRSHAAMGDGNARIGRRRNGAGNAGHLFEGDAGLTEHLDFLSPSAENEGIPAFETGHNLPFLSLFRQKEADFMLLHGMAAGLLAYVHIFSVRAGVAEEPPVRQVVSHNDIRFLQAPLSLQCQKFRISGACAD